MAVRRPAEWMSAADDRLMEYLESNGAASVSTIDEAETVRYHYETIGRRLRLLSKAGLVERIGQGVYRLAPEGMEYLNGARDLGDFPDPEDSL